MIRTPARLAAGTVLFVTSAVVNGSPSTNGILEGQVNILQSRGTELADDASPQTKKSPCADCPVVVMSKDGKNEIAQVAVDAEGRFRVNLPAGAVMVPRTAEALRINIAIGDRPYYVHGPWYGNNGVR